jgi:hypothetical protein
MHSVEWLHRYRVQLLHNRDFVRHARPGEMGIAYRESTTRCRTHISSYPRWTIA